MSEWFLKTPWRFLLWKDVIEWISNEKLHLFEQGLSTDLDYGSFTKPHNVSRMITYEIVCYCCKTLQASLFFGTLVLGR